MDLSQKRHGDVVALVAFVAIVVGVVVAIVAIVVDVVVLVVDVVVVLVVVAVVVVVVVVVIVVVVVVIVDFVCLSMLVVPLFVVDTLHRVVVDWLVDSVVDSVVAKTATLSTNNCWLETDLSLAEIAYVLDCCLVAMALDSVAFGLIVPIEVARHWTKTLPKQQIGRLLFVRPS